MNKKSGNLNAKILFMVLLVSLGLSSLSFAAMQYQITITNLSPNVLSPAAFISHNSSFDLFNNKGPASSAVELLAETGNSSEVISLAAAGSISVADYGVASNGILHQGESGQVILEADLAHPWLSFMSMMGISNDGFIGGTTGDLAIPLFYSGNPVYSTYYIDPAYVWDAGTEVNDEAFGSVGALGGGNGGVDENFVVTLNHPGISGNFDIPLANNWTDGTVAKITIAPVPPAADPVPIPGAIWLLGTGLIGFVGLRRQQNQ
jgi:hypothetical protein